MPIQKITSGIIQDGAVAAADIVSVSNTAISGLITASQIAAVNGSVITANTIANSAIQTGAVEGYLRGVNLDFGMRNRIINGAMVIDQRNSGAAITPSATGTNIYNVDRWFYFQSQASKMTIQQNSGAITAPAGFSYYLGANTASAVSIGSNDYFGVGQMIEGFNTADLAWGTASARPITLSFWVRSSLTGTFGGAIQNGAQNRSYPFTYTINSANTWEYETITIPGDTSGTWVGATSSASIRINFGFGMGSTFSGTSGAWAAGNAMSATGAVSVVGTGAATWYVTGVQFEEGSVPTPFEYRHYSSEILLCQRYARTYGDGLQGVGRTTSDPFFNIPFFPNMRVAPTFTLTDTSVKISDDYATDYTSSGSSISQTDASPVGCRISINGFGAALTIGRHYGAYGNTNGNFLLLEAEL